MRFIDIVQEASKSRSTQAQKFVADALANSRFCEFEIESKNAVVLAWLEGGGGLVPFLTNIADKYGVTLEAMVEVYGQDDGGRLIPYYLKNGFHITGSDFPDDFDFNKMKPKTGNKLLGQVTLKRTPTLRKQKPSVDQ